MADKKDVAKVVNPSELALSRVNAIIDNINTKYMAPSDDPAAAIAQMAATILDAETFEEMFLAANLEPAAELFDVGLHLEEISFNRSDYTEGFPFYATLRGKRLDNGEEFVCNCGAWQVVLVAYKTLENGWLPCGVMLHRSERATRGGYHPVNILRYDAF
jgi:hypothetical protein